jgi:dipeptidyl aminopeptidase/acylaminoacyl peptidase
MYRQILSITLTLFLTLSISSCKQNSTGSESDLGTAEVVITTSGEQKGAYPYILFVDETTEEEVSAEGREDGTETWTQTTTLELTAGSHDIELTNLVPNCSVEEDNPSTITISAGETTQAEFNVVCLVALNNKVVFVSDRDGPTDLYIADPGKSPSEGFSNYKKLTNDDYPESHPAVSSDGTKIAYVQSGNIWVINADGTNPAQLTENSLNTEPTWFYDNTKIAFISTRDEISQLYVINADGSGETRLATEQAVSGACCDASTPLIIQELKIRNKDEDKASPKLMLSMGGGDDAEIVVLDLDDDGDAISTMTPLTDNNQYDGYPALSPDGSELVIVREDAAGVKNLVRIDAESGETLSTSKFERGFIDDQAHPGWSPDGTELLFTSVGRSTAKLKAQDYNSSRSNKPNTIIDTDDTAFNVFHVVWSPAW